MQKNKKGRMNNSELNKCLWCDSFSDADGKEGSSPSRAEYTGDLPVKTLLLLFHQVDRLIPTPPHTGNT